MINTNQNFEKMTASELTIMNFDIDQFLQDKYYEAVSKNGLSYEPETFLADFDIAELADHEAFAKPLYDKNEDSFYDLFGDMYDEFLCLAIELRARGLVRNYDPDKLEDVRYDEANRRDYQRDSLAYYGVSKSDFYPS